MNQLKELKSKQRKTIFVLVSGRAGVGKTTFSNFGRDFLIENEIRYTTILPFAIGVKNIARVMSWDGKKDEKGRKFLQDLGKLGRWYNEDIWVELSLEFLNNKSIVPMDVIFMDDWRFPNEGKYIEDLGIYSVYKVRIHAPKRESLLGTDRYNDPSEISLPERGVMYDYFINNNDITLEELNQKAQEVVLDIYQKEV